MQERRDPSFFSTKKNPAPNGEEEQRIMSAASESLMQVSMASCSGREMLNNWLEGNGAPDRRSIAQSYGWWGGKEKALVLLNSAVRLWYSEGICGGERWNGDKWSDKKKTRTQYLIWTSWCVDCVVITRKKPRTTEDLDVGKTKKEISSQCLPEIMRWRSLVMWMIWGNGLPSRAVTRRGEISGKVSIWDCWIMPQSIKLCSQPESKRTERFRESLLNSSVAGSSSRGDDFSFRWPSSLLESTGKLGLLVERDSVQ